MYQMPVRAIKSILGQELDKFKDVVSRAANSACLADAGREMVVIGYEAMKAALEKCNDYESLEEYISFAGYRMSLEEWVNSL